MPNCKDKERNHAIHIWDKMKQKCTNPGEPTYRHIGKKGVVVCEEWQSFEGFYSWYKDHYYEIDGKPTYLCRFFGNGDGMEYSPETCAFVPREIHDLFFKIYDRAVGVYPHKTAYKVVAQNPITHKPDTVCPIATFDEARRTYMKLKNLYLEDLLEKYGDKMPLYAYDAVYTFRFDDD